MLLPLPLSPPPLLLLPLLNYTSMLLRCIRLEATTQLCAFYTVYLYVTDVLSLHLQAQPPLM